MFISILPLPFRRIIGPYQTCDLLLPDRPKSNAGRHYDRPQCISERRTRRAKFLNSCYQVDESGSVGTSMLLVRYHDAESGRFLALFPIFMVLGGRSTR